MRDSIRQAIAATFIGAICPKSKHGSALLKFLGRRKPEAFAADAVSLWILNQSLLIIKKLALYDEKLI